MKNHFLHYMAIACFFFLIAPDHGSASEATNHVVMGHADFDGDSKADPVEYAPSNGLWRVCLSGAGYAVAPFILGGGTCLPAAADYDGDRRADPAVFNQADGQMWVKLSSAGYAQFPLLIAGSVTSSVPVVADFDGDRFCDPSVYDADSGIWITRLSSAGYLEIALAFGSAGSEAAAADYDGDGLTDPGVFDASAMTLTVKISSAGYATIPVHFSPGFAWTMDEAGGAGSTNACAVCADYDGDRMADPMIYRESSGAWHGLLSGSSYVPTTFTYGTGLRAAPGDYNGDGKADPAVYQESPACIGVYFPEGADTPGTFQQTNTLHTGAIISDAVKAGDDAIAVIYGKDQAEYGYACIWWEMINHAGGVIAEGPVLYNNESPLSAYASAALVMDLSRKPHIFTSYYNDTIKHLYQSGSVWTNENVSSSGYGSSTAMARMDANGYFHVVSVGLDESNSEIARVRHYTNRSGAWQVEETSVNVGPSRWLWDQDFAVDSDGWIHVILSMQYHPSQDVTWPGTIYYLCNSGGTWLEETVAYKTHNSWDSFFPRFSLAVNPQGRPAVAAWLKYNVLTGSDALSQLVFYRRTGANSWSEEILADTADNYFGTDGGHFTGLYPKMAFDSLGCAHIVFSDLASSHINGYESASVGQIRYASNSSGSWVISTLYRQSAAARDGVSDRYLMVSSDGRGMDVVARLYPNNDSIVHFSSSKRTVFYFE